MHNVVSVEPLKTTDHLLQIHHQLGKCRLQNSAQRAPHSCDDIQKLVFGVQTQIYEYLVIARARCMKFLP